MTATEPPGAAPGGDWPEVAVPGGALVDQAAPVGGTASPVVDVPAGQGAAAVDESVETVGSRRPGPVRPRPSLAHPKAGPGPVAVRPDKAAETSPGAPSGFDVCTSRRCRQKIRWARTLAGERVPVDYAPDPLGALVWVMKARGDWRLREIGSGEDADAGLKRWSDHRDTCPEATRFRRRSPAPAVAAVVAGPVLEVVAPAPPGRLLVVDGPSLAHRAYHAYLARGFRDPDGRPVWAIYGFLALLVGVIDRVGPDAVLVGFDDRQASARRDRYPEYKAGRGERDEDLHVQLDQLPGLLAELGVATMTPPALEADDVLASAAAAAEAAGWRCTLATSDKDAFGLITDAVTVLRLVSGLDNAVVMTPAALEVKLGVTPGQYRDFCALVGDKSDNLPGVAGIGPVKAAQLLAAVGSLDAALDAEGRPTMAAVEAIGKGYAGKLAAAGAAEAIARNRDLMAPVLGLRFDLEACRPQITGRTVARVLKARHVPGLIDRTVAVLARDTPVAGARLAPVPAPPVAPAARPGVVVRGLPAPALAEMTAEQDETVRTCGDCGELCAAGVSWLDGSGSVLLTGEHVFGEAVLVKVDTGWVAEPMAGYGGNVGNRRSVHRCRSRPGRCVTPGHEDRPASLYPGGYFCDGCAGGRGSAARQSRNET